MKTTIPNSPKWGFRFSVIDAVALAAFGLIAFLLKKSQSDLWWLLVIAAAHFFLFCNVFRIVRRLELIWAGSFIVNVAIWLWSGKLACSNVILCQLPITATIVGIGIRAWNYHGILANYLNPRLCVYLDGRYER